MFADASGAYATFVSVIDLPLASLRRTLPLAWTLIRCGPMPPIVGRSLSAMKSSSSKCALWDVLRYVQNNTDVGIIYAKSKTPATEFDPMALNKDNVKESEPRAAVDSDFAMDPDTSKSVTGFIVTLMDAAVSWRSKQQSLVATSSAHAEYVAASELAREVVWVRMLLTDIGFTLTDPSIVLEDNTAAEQMVKTLGVTDRNKHIRVKWHYVRECVQEGLLRFERVASKNNPADALTKPTTREPVEVMKRAAGMGRVDLSLAP